MAITIRNKTTEAMIREIGRQRREGPSAVVRRLAAKELGQAPGEVSREEYERRRRAWDELGNLVPQRPSGFPGKGSKPKCRRCLIISTKRASDAGRRYLRPRSHLQGGRGGATFGAAIMNAAHLAVPASCLVEFRLLRRIPGDHPARLNFGERLSYAVARHLDAALLFKGDDFGLTDIRSAVAA